MIRKCTSYRVQLILCRASVRNVHRETESGGWCDGSTYAAALYVTSRLGAMPTTESIIFGVDSHARTTTICALETETGVTTVRTFRGNGYGSMAEWMAKYPAPAYDVYEAGCTGFVPARLMGYTDTRDDGFVVFVPRKENTVTAAKVAPTHVVQDMLRYDYCGFEGDLVEKKSMLGGMLGEIEPKRKELERLSRPLSKRSLLYCEQLQSAPQQHGSVRPR